LVREDLSLPQQTVQACHAAISAAELYLGRPTDNLVVCGVKSEEALHKARDHLEAHGIRLVTFCEPDIGDQLTALATEPIFDDLRKVFRKFQLIRGRAL
jgi:hypothetical protein